MLTVTEVIEDGIKYRISEDKEKGFYLKEGIDESPATVLPPTPDQIRIADLEQETVSLMLALTQVYEEKEADKAAAEQESINNMLAITELYEMMLTLQGGTA